MEIAHGADRCPWRRRDGERRGLEGEVRDGLDACGEAGVELVVEVLEGVAKPEEEAKERRCKGGGQPEPTARNVSWEEGLCHAIQRRASMGREGDIERQGDFLTCGAAGRLAATAHSLVLPVRMPDLHLDNHRKQTRASGIIPLEK